MRPGSIRAVLSGPPLTLSDVIRGGYFSHVTKLIQMGIDVNGRDAEGKTPIMLCALINDEAWGVGIARTLVEKGAQLNITDKFGLSAIHLAVIYERENLINIFLNAADFDPNLVDKLGNTALHYAAMSGNRDMTRVLVQYWNKYSLDGGIRNRRGRTASDEAYAASHYACVSQLNNLTTTPCRMKSAPNKRPETSLPRRLGSSCSSYTVSSEVSDQSVFTDMPRSSRHSTLHSAIYPERPRSSRHSTLHSAIYPERPRSSRHSTLHSVIYPERPRSSRHSTLHSVIYPERPRSSRQCLLPNEKNREQVIHSANQSDFRNKKEYIFKLTAIPYDENDLCEKSVRNVRAALCAHPVLRCAEPVTWRCEFQRLFHEYEFQCSPSYRDAAKSATDHMLVAPVEEEEADDKEKKRLCRRTSLMSRSSTFSEQREKRKPGSTIKQRKVSVLPPPLHARSIEVTDAKTSSSESSSNSQSWKKKEAILCKDVSRIQIHTTDVAADQQTRADNSSIPAVTETLVTDDDRQETSTIETECDVDTSRLSVLNQTDN
ncbi:ankyrin repeat domain-containing protein 55-like [Gigantopelta aegis]|uniref:ankyrin repeat domain-containing protein 55-like n=1 Tax=Gigantopelta aegis TaxID=1735272 RepID=UPI001B88E258|nr:ankyrin repeat domain-containing protein 55-like [Gigantopelta aegis]